MLILVTLATVLVVGAVLGSEVRRRLLCSPTCQRHGVWLWTPEQEEAAWERGTTVGVAYQRGDLAGTRLEDRVWRLLTRRERTEDTTDERMAA